MLVAKQVTLAKPKALVFFWIFVHVLSQPYSLSTMFSLFCLILELGLASLLAKPIFVLEVYLG